MKTRHQSADVRTEEKDNLFIILDE